MDAGLCFAPDYRTARQLFLTEVAEAGGTGKAFVNPHRGPHGEELAADAAWFGPEDASRVLLMLSATHGVEGFCGSGAQIDWLMTGGPAALPSDTAALLVHAINPHGFAWLRRTTEEGVDLNRNCIAFDGALPDNPGYRELAAAFVPTSLDPETLHDAANRIAAYRQEHGERAFEQARS